MLGKRLKKQLTGVAPLDFSPGLRHIQAQQPGKSGSNLPFAYRALIDLKAQHLIADGVLHSLTPGMQVTAEIHLGTRTILEYLLSPVMGAFQEAGKER